MEFVSTQKFIRMSPKKLRYVADVVRKLKAEEAADKLPFVGRRAGGVLRKAVLVALANARQAGVDTTTLTFKELQINEGPRLKRWQAGSRGRAKPYVRPMSHIRIVLETVEMKAKTEEKKEVVKETEVEKVKKDKPTLVKRLGSIRKPKTEKKEEGKK